MTLAEKLIREILINFISVNVNDSQFNELSESMTSPFSFTLSMNNHFRFKRETKGNEKFKFETIFSAKVIVLKKMIFNCFKLKLFVSFRKTFRFP